MRSDQENLDLFRVYLDQIGRHPLLTGADEIELSQAIEAGDDAARRKKIESNLRLVVSIALEEVGAGRPEGSTGQRESRKVSTARTRR